MGSNLSVAAIQCSTNLIFKVLRVSGVQVSLVGFTCLWLAHEDQQIHLISGIHIFLENCEKTIHTPHGEANIKQYICSVH